MHRLSQIAGSEPPSRSGRRVVRAHGLLTNGLVDDC